jgi:hypothetical protein
VAGVLVVAVPAVAAMGCGAGPAGVVIMPRCRLTGMFLGAGVVQRHRGRVVFMTVAVSVVDGVSVLAVGRHVDHLHH